MNIDELKKLKVAIVGGGYGGAAAGLALSRLGVDVTVYEQAPATGEVGAGIGLRPRTLQLFREWGAFDEIAAVSSPSDYFEILTATGQVIAREEWPEINNWSEPNHTRMIHRGDFIKALLRALPEGIVKLGYKVTDIEDHGNGATLTFADGSTADADLVIGADGIRSFVRTKFFTDAPLVYSGCHAYRTVISGDDAQGMLIDDNLRLYMDDTGAMVYFLPLRHRNAVSFDVTVLSSDDSWAPEVTRDDLVAILQGFDERLVTITENLDMDLVTSRAVFDIEPVDNWHTDSVALLGDAAHAMLHHQGQGANQAIQDAGGLAEALQRAGSVKEALALYQEIRKPVTDELQRVSRASWNPDQVETAFPGQKQQS